MTPGEKHELKRQNFKTNSLKEFTFLSTNFNLNQPSIKEYKQENGTITRDEITFSNSSLKVEISNSYHPVDYGFEIKVTTNNKKELVYFKLKEEQDLEQTYLKEASNKLKAYLN